MENEFNEYQATEEVTLSDGKLIVLALDQEECSVRFYLNGEEKDTNQYFLFEEQKTAGKYKIMHMFSPFAHNGLGRAALTLFKDNMNATIYVQPIEGPEMTDGSNILPEAIPFVRRMMEEGLIEKQDED